MSNPFAYNDQAAKPTDRVGGYTVPESGIYDFIVKIAYTTATARGGMALTLVGMQGEAERTYTLYPIIAQKDANGKPVLDAKGVPVQTNMYMRKDGTRHYLEDFLIADSLAKIAAGVPLSNLMPVDLIVDIQDYATKTKVATTVKGWKEFQGRPIKVAVQRLIENKKIKSGNDWVVTNETQQKSKLVKILDSATSRTTLEIETGITEAVYAPDWLKLWKGKDVDNTVKTANAGVAGMPSGLIGTTTAATPIDFT